MECACGCHQEITRKPRPGRLNKFVHGHHRRGIPMSEEQKRKIGISNSRPMTKTQRRLLSKIKLQGYAIGKYVNFWKGKRNERLIEGRKKWVENYVSKKPEERKNGGRVKRGDGYYLVFDPGHGKHVLEHRLIMEKYLGRPLKPAEDVHHADGDRSNNVIENLVLFPSRSAHLRFHGGK